MSNKKKDKFGSSSLSCKERRKVPCVFGEDLIARAAKEIHIDKNTVSKCVYAFLRELREELLHYQKEINIFDFGIIKIVPRRFQGVKNVVDFEKRPDLATMFYYPQIHLKLRPKYTKELTMNVRFDENKKLIVGDDITAEPEE